jgi:hypothetical protein
MLPGFRAFTIRLPKFWAYSTDDRAHWQNYLWREISDANIDYQQVESGDL